MTFVFPGGSLLVFIVKCYVLVESTIQVAHLFILNILNFYLF